MSREVRRVPLDWKHPTEPNPYWREQKASREWRGEAHPTLHGERERFVGLSDDYPRHLTNWESEGEDLRARTGHSWTFRVEYHLTGYKGQQDTEAVVHPWFSWDDDEEAEIPIVVRDEDHLHELMLAQHESERPDPADYMPVWDVPEAELGWCLYQTVSEGAPITPVFPTAEALIQHLSTVGTDWGGPLRREAAEQIVSTGYTIGSMVSVGGKLYDSTEDADLIPAALKASAP